MKKKLLIIGGVALGALALLWLSTPKPDNWAALPLSARLQYLFARFSARRVDGSQFE